MGQLIRLIHMFHCVFAFRGVRLPLEALPLRVCGLYHLSLENLKYARIEVKTFHSIERGPDGDLSIMELLTILKPWVLGAVVDKCRLWRNPLAQRSEIISYLSPKFQQWVGSPNFESALAGKNASQQNRCLMSRTSDNQSWRYFYSESLHDAASIQLTHFTELLYN